MIPGFGRTTCSVAFIPCVMEGKLSGVSNGVGSVRYGLAPKDLRLYDCMINGHFRNRLIGGTDSIYKAYVLGLCKGISLENM